MLAKPERKKSTMEIWGDGIHRKGRELAFMRPSWQNLKMDKSRKKGMCWSKSELIVLTV